MFLCNASPWLCENVIYIDGSMSVGSDKVTRICPPVVVGDP